MSSPVVKFEGLETNFINEKQLSLTLKLVPCEPGPSSYGDVLNILDHEGVKPDELLGLYKVSQSDISYSVFLSNEAVLNRLVKRGVIGHNKLKFNVVSMCEQIVTLRVHWLPLFYDNRLLKAIFCDYGEVLGVRMCKSSHAQVVALNGLREVTLKTDEVLKQKIPHLVKFNSGQSILVTMMGRPPLCLKCHEVGHVRRDCGNQRSFAQATVNVGSMPGAPSALSAQVPPASASDKSSDQPDTVSTPTEGTGDSGSGVAETGSQGSSQAVEAVEENMDEGSGGSKRGLEVSDDDFISPNKTAKSRSWSQDPVPTSNAYAAILDLAELVADTQTDKLNS